MLDAWGLEFVFGVGWSSTFSGRDYYNCNEPENDLSFLPVVFSIFTSLPVGWDRQPVSLQARSDPTPVFIWSSS